MNHDTAPAPPPRAKRNCGGCHDEDPPVVKLALLETREYLRELFDSTTAIRLRLDDEIKARVVRDASIEQAILELTASVGTSPDPIAGTAGTGLKGAVAKLLNHTIREGVRREHPSIVDDEESEITGVMDRSTLVIEKRKARRDFLAAKARARKIEIGAWASGAVLVIGAIAAAVAQLVQH